MRLFQDISPGQQHEKNVSTKQPQACTHAWFSRAHGDQVGTQDHQCTPCKGPCPTGFLTIPISGCFTRRQRLLTAADYTRVFTKAQRSSDRYFTVLMRQHAGGPARLGLAIAKKQLPRAVDRNRVKRIVRESFRQHQLQDHDFVVLARWDTLTATNDELFASLRLHWKRLLNPFHSPTFGSSDG